MVRHLILAVLFSPLAASAIAQSADGIFFTQRVTSGGTPLTIQVQIEATRMRTSASHGNRAAISRSQMGMSIAISSLSCARCRCCSRADAAA